MEFSQEAPAQAGIVAAALSMFGASLSVASATGDLARPVALKRGKELLTVGSAPAGAGVPARLGRILAAEQAFDVIVAGGDVTKHLVRPKIRVQKGIEVADPRSKRRIDARDQARP